MKLRFLGTGTSTGVPEVGCTCPVCTSTDFRDNRLRTSALLHTDDGHTILIDCGPDFREQMIRSRWFGRIDGVLITHEHYDHVGGLDDLRPYCRFGEVPVFSDVYTAEHLRMRMPYCFVEHKYPGVPRISLHELKAGVPFNIGSTEILPFEVMHGRLPILGFRIDSRLAYVTDMLTMSDDSYRLLEGIEILVMNALRPTPHGSHQSIPEALKAARRIGAHKTYFVHMGHHAGLHAEISRQLPPNIYFAYDGMELDF